MPTSQNLFIFLIYWDKKQTNFFKELKRSHLNWFHLKPSSDHSPLTTHLMPQTLFPPTRGIKLETDLKYINFMLRMRFIFFSCALSLNEMMKKESFGTKLRLLMLKLKWYNYSLHKLQFSDFWPFLHPDPNVPHLNCYSTEEGNKTHIYKNLASGKNPFKEFTSWHMVYMTCPLFFSIPPPLNLSSKLNFNYWIHCSFLALLSIFISLGMESARNWIVRPMFTPYPSTTDVHTNHLWLGVIIVN